MRRPLAPWIPVSAFVCWVFVLCAGTALGAPLVSNVKFGMQRGTRLVDVTYDLSGGTCSIGLSVSSDNGVTFAVPVKSVTGAVGNGVTAGTGKRIVWDAGTDWPGQTSSQVKFRVTAWDMLQGGSYGFVPVLGGTLPAGSTLEGQVVGDFEIGKYEVTWGEWKTVREWALNNGYSELANLGVGTEDNYPVTNVSWYDVVKWCNALSEMDGKTPVYEVVGATYKGGQSAPTVRLTANGYRLPTQAEWEWAARGGSLTRGYVYSGSDDLSSVGWFFENSGEVTHSVGTLAANELGIFDMSGNVWELCEGSWPGYEGSVRLLRGGSCSNQGMDCAVDALCVGNLKSRWDSFGFRLARGRS